MDIQFWGGLLLALPLSIAANILTPKFQAWAARRSEKSAAGLRMLEAQDAATMARYKEDPMHLVIDLVTNVLGVCFFAAVVAGTTTVAFAAYSWSDLEVFGFVAYFLPLIGAIFIAQMCIEQIRVVSRWRRSLTSNADNKKPGN